MVSAFAKSSLSFENRQVTQTGTRSKENRFRGLPTKPSSLNPGTSIPWLGARSHHQHSAKAGRSSLASNRGSLSVPPGNFFYASSQKSNFYDHNARSVALDHDPTNMIVTTKATDQKDDSETLFPMSQLSEESGSLSHSSRLHQRSIGSTPSNQTFTNKQFNAFDTPARLSSTRMGGGNLNTPAYGARRLPSVTSFRYSAKSKMSNVHTNRQLFPAELQKQTLATASFYAIPIGQQNTKDDPQLPHLVEKQEHFDSLNAVRMTAPETKQALAVTAHHDTETKLQNHGQQEAHDIHVDVTNDLASHDKSNDSLDEVAKIKFDIAVEETTNQKIEELQNQFKILQKKAEEEAIKLQAQMRKEHDELLSSSRKQIHGVCEQFENTYFQNLKRKLFDECLPFLSKHIESAVSVFMKRSESLVPSISSLTEDTTSASFHSPPPVTPVLPPTNSQMTGLSSITQDSHENDQESIASTRESASTKAVPANQKKPQQKNCETVGTKRFSTHSRVSYRRSKRQKGLPPSPTRNSSTVHSCHDSQHTGSDTPKTPTRRHDDSIESSQPPPLDRKKNSPTWRKVCVTPTSSRVVQPSLESVCLEKSLSNMKEAKSNAVCVSKNVEKDTRRPNDSSKSEPPKRVSKRMNAACNTVKKVCATSSSLMRDVQLSLESAENLEKGIQRRNDSSKSEPPPERASKRAKAGSNTGKKICVTPPSSTKDVQPLNFVFNAKEKGKATSSKSNAVCVSKKLEKERKQRSEPPKRVRKRAKAADSNTGKKVCVTPPPSSRRGIQPLLDSSVCPVSNAKANGISASSSKSNAVCGAKNLEKEKEQRDSSKHEHGRGSKRMKVVSDASMKKMPAPKSGKNPGTKKSRKIRVYGGRSSRLRSLPLRSTDDFSFSFV